MRVLIVTIVFAIAVPLLSGQTTPSKSIAKIVKPKRLAPLTAEQRTIHALSRFTFGPRPGDVQRVQQMGLETWFEQQLEPEKIDDKALGAHLAALRTVRKQPKDLLAHFPNDPMLRNVLDGRMPMPDDPATRMIYEVQMERLREQQMQRQQQAQSLQPTKMSGSSADAPNLPSDADVAAANEIAGRILVTPPNQRLAQMEGLPVHDLQLLLTVLKPEVRNRLVNELPPADREIVAALQYPSGLVTNELAQAKLLLAIYSERQLQEVMTDFWMNHFNVFINKDADRYFTATYERDVIRPRALGKFQDLLVAVAHSPAMLFYLDNWLSVGPDSPAADQARRNQSKNPQAAVPGVNENYARELMELHTLGVNGGYTQQDVQEVAKVFTGWTIDQPQMGGAFKFDPRRHEPGPKTVLGHSIGTPDSAVANASLGEGEGMQVLDLLAHQPSTAKFISLKLARRLVADDAPPALVNRMADSFLRSDGDIREVLRTMFHSPEFWSPQHYRTKIKSPLEFVASAMRACGADVQNAQPLVNQLQRMGMPLYASQPPTGYSSLNEAWTNSDALLDRMNFAVQLATARRNDGVQCDPAQTLALATFKMPSLANVPSNLRRANPNYTQSTESTVLSYLERALVPSGVSAKTNDAVLKRLSEPDLSANGGPPDATAALKNILALLLGSPEFQQR